MFHAPHYVLPPLTPCRTVVTIHDCIHLRFPQYLPSRFGYAYARAAMWTATHRAARVITVSEASKRDILQYFHIPESRIDVIYNAIDDRFWQPPDAENMERVRQRYQLNAPFILYAGNIKPHKNLERLIEAFHLLRQEPAMRDVQLLIIGDEISKYADAPPGGAPAQAAQARPLLRLRTARHAGRALSTGGRVRVSVPL